MKGMPRHEAKERYVEYVKQLFRLQGALY